MATLFSILFLFMIFLFIISILILRSNFNKRSEILNTKNIELVKSVDNFLRRFFELLHNNSKLKNSIINKLDMNVKYNMISYDNILNQKYLFDSIYYSNDSPIYDYKKLLKHFDFILDNFETFNRYDQILILKFADIYLEKDKVIAEKENNKTVRIILNYNNRLTTKYKLLFKQSLDMSRFKYIEL